ncbi:hypothetical protein [Lysobacter sp. FW306-1B-D06B]|uniref:hypothetical protein n=1 Tax=Lysobacter sp. FW306-1B-D06B TaxID=3140250 RepID=UPI00313FF595
MKRPAQIAIFILIAVLGAAGVAWQVQRVDARTGAPPSTPSDVERNTTSTTATLLARPQVREYQERLAFEERARRFFLESSTLPPAAREREAQEIARGTDRYANTGDLSAGESLMLRIGLIRATDPDAVRQADRVGELIAHYRLDAERRNAAFVQAQQHDPAFNDYKQRERRVVAEVMAMATIPDGLSRDEYLRQRLQREREIAYGR